MKGTISCTAILVNLVPTTSCVPAMPLHPALSAGMLVLLACFCLSAAAQTGKWAWMGGSNLVSDPELAYAGQAGVCGTEGVPAPANLPGSRESSVAWTDPKGHFWLFGGHGYDCVGVRGYLNDLWEFDPATNQWAWISGSYSVNLNDYSQPGVYGKLGVPAPGNTPGSREYAAAWTDKSGHLWLFGGLGFDAKDHFTDLNDLWEFDTATGEWTWMGGVSADPDAPVGLAPIYGTLHVPAAGNNPGSRAMAATWTDSSGHFWVFGGGGSGNDLWEYFPDKNEWAWMGGSNQLQPAGSGLPGVYGTLGKPAVGNNPGARTWTVTWTDANGHLWLFGGLGDDEEGNNGFLNDLWEFEPAIGEWAWMGGNQTLGAVGSNCRQGVYGKQGYAAKGNIPGGRSSAVSWVGKSGKFWLFGGTGCDSGDINLGDLNDLWEFDPATLQWTWWDGSKTDSDPPYGTFGSYGTLGAPGDHSFPGSRDSGAASVDAAGHLWLFGGWGTDSQGYLGYLDDVWEYSPPGMLPEAVSPVFDPPAGDYVAGQTVTISEFTPGTTVYYTLDGSTPKSSSQRYLGPLTIDRTTTLTAIAGGSGFVNSAATSAIYTVTSSTAAPVIAPPAGTYSTEQSVTLSCSNPHAKIYYTMDGSTPTANSAVYSAPLRVWESTTVNAIAIAPGLSMSGPSSAAYTIQEPIAWANEWARMSRSDGAAVFGEKGVTSTLNFPETPEGAQSWVDAGGHIWIFGAAGLNALWEFDPASDLWTWVSGPNTTKVAGGNPPVYGTLGVPAPDNTPGALTGAATWTDKSGNLWLFGGNGVQVLPHKPETMHCLLNDLWKYDPSTNEWTWMGGSTGVLPSGGNSTTCGVPGVYGKLGIPAKTNYPGSRAGAAAWTDKDGNFWLFGGGGKDSRGLKGIFNDLWEFNPSTGMWTWIAGNSKLPNECVSASNGYCGWPPVYGKKGIPSTANLPSSGGSEAVWTDKSGIIWFFGGSSFAGASSGALILWTFNPATHEWTWIDGDGPNATITCTPWAPPPAFGGHFCGEPSNYGTMGVPDPENHPGGGGYSANWIDSSGNLWLYGGVAPDFPGTFISNLGVDPKGYFWGPVNDLWVYKPSTHTWTWMGGASKTENCIGIPGPGAVDVICAGPPAVLGTYETPGAGTTPGSPYSPPVGRADNDGNFWLLSYSEKTPGFDETYVSLLSKFQPSTAVLPPAVTPELGVISGTYASGGPLTIYASMKNATIYYTTDGTTPTANSKVYKTQLTIASSITVKAIAMAPGYRTSGVVTGIYTILPPTATPTFSPPGGTYSSSQTVKISDATPGAKIYYTTDGVTVNQYATPITISKTTTLSAAAEAKGYGESQIATATYTIDLKAASRQTPSPRSSSGSAKVSGAWPLLIRTPPWSMAPSP